MKGTLSPIDKFSCPVCGYPELHWPPYDDYGVASFEICPCCGIEFGYQDAGRSHAELREKWLANGAPWHSKYTHPPTDWSAQSQLEQAGLPFGDGEHNE